MHQERSAPSFAEMAFALHWAPAELVLALWAYFDESGHPSEDIPLAVAGCVATCEAWREFESDWLRVLKDHGVSWFHAVDLEHAHGEFAAGGGDRQRRERLLDALIQVVGRHALPPVGCLVPTHEVRRLRSRRPRGKKSESAEERLVREAEELFADPYCCALAYCMKTAAEQFALPRDVLLHVVLAFRDKTVGKAERLWAIAQEISPFRDRMAGLTTGRGQDPRRLPQLQAADLIAYEITRSTHQTKIRRGFQQLRGLKIYLSKADPARVFQGWLADPSV